MVPRSEMTCYALLAILGLGTEHMRRRDFIAVVAGGAAGWALVARARAAQGPERIRKIGMLLNFQSQDPEGEARVKAFVQALQKLGWTHSVNVRIEMRWAGDDAIAIVVTQRNWSRWSRTSSLPLPALVWLRCSGSPTLCRSCSRM